MPNWCTNYVQFNGDEENIDALHKRLTANVRPRKTSGWWVELEPVERADDSRGTLFARALDFSDLGAGCPQADYGYFKSIACIGSKWDPEFTIEAATPTSIKLAYESAWSPTLRGLVLIGVKYGVNVRVEYEEPGCDFGGVLVYDAATRSVAGYSTTYLHWRRLEQGGYETVKDFIEEYYDGEDVPDELLAESESWDPVESVDELLSEKHDVDDWLELELCRGTLLLS